MTSLLSNVIKSAVFMTFDPAILLDIYNVGVLI